MQSLEEEKKKKKKEEKKKKEKTNPEDRNPNPWRNRSQNRTTP